MKGRTPEELAVLPTITPKQIENLRANLRLTKQLTPALKQQAAQATAKYWETVGYEVKIQEIDGEPTVVPLKAPSVREIIPSSSPQISFQGKPIRDSEDPEQKLAQTHEMMANRFLPDLKQEAKRDANKKIAAWHQERIHQGRELTKGEEKMRQIMVDFQVNKTVLQITGLDNLGPVDAQTVQMIKDTEPLIDNARNDPEVLTMQAKLEKQFEEWHKEKDRHHPHRPAKRERNIFKL